MIPRFLIYYYYHEFLSTNSSRERYLVADIWSFDQIFPREFGKRRWLRGNCQILRWNEATKFLLPFAYTRFFSRLNQLKTQQERGTRWKRMQSWIRSTKIRFVERTVFEENNYTGWRANYYSISWSIIELLGSLLR